MKANSKAYSSRRSNGFILRLQVLLGAYPDVFKAGVAYSGVPYGCFAGPNAWNSACADGQLIETPQQWVA